MSNVRYFPAGSTLRHFVMNVREGKFQPPFTTDCEDLFREVLSAIDQLEIEIRDLDPSRARERNRNFEKGWFPVQDILRKHSSGNEKPVSFLIKDHCGEFFLSDLEDGHFSGGWKLDNAYGRKIPGDSEIKWEKIIDPAMLPMGKTILVRCGDDFELIDTDAEPDRICDDLEGYEEWANVESIA